MRKLVEYSATFGDGQWAEGAVLTDPDESTEEAITRQINEEGGQSVEVGEVTVEETEVIMQTYTVHGERDVEGDTNDFKAPVAASSVEEAKDKFLESVGDGFRIIEVEE